MIFHDILEVRHSLNDNENSSCGKQGLISSRARVGFEIDEERGVEDWLLASRHKKNGKKRKKKL